MEQIKDLLKSYAEYEKQFFAEKYAETFFDPYKTFQKLDNGECLKQMDFIKSLIIGFAPSSCATILNLHYINGLSIEKCAECMVMSRRSAYRLLDRAHIAISKRYQRMKGEW